VSKIFVDQVDPKTGTSLTLGTSGDTVNIPSGVTLANAGTMTGVPASAISSGTIATARLGSGTASSSTFLRGDQTYAAAGETNSPSFLTTLSGAQSIANTTDVTVGFNSTTGGFDTDSGFNTGTHTYTIPSGKGGKYYMYTGFYLASNVADKFWAVKFVTTSGQRGEIYGNSNSASGVTPRAYMIQNFSAGDTVFVRIYHNFGGAKNTGNGIQGTYFGGFKLI